MAYKKHYILPFRTLHTNTLYTINIYEDGYEGDDVVELTGAEEPFDTQMDNDDDFTKAYRGQTGHINIVTTDRTLLNALMPTSPKALMVKVYKGETGKQSFMWSGYIQMQAMSQSYLAGTYELQIPVISALGLWAETSLPMTKTGMVTWQSLITAMNDDGLAVAGGLKHYQYYIYPSTTPEILTKGFIEEMFKELRDFEDVYREGADSKNFYEPKTYGDILDDFLKLHGYVLYEEEGNLILKDVTGQASAYRKSTFTNMSSWSDIETDDVSDFTFASDNNTEDYVEAKKSITLTHEDNNIDSLFKVDDDIFRARGTLTPNANEYESATARTITYRTNAEITTPRYRLSCDVKNELIVQDCNGLPVIYNLSSRGVQYGGEVGLFKAGGEYNYGLVLRDPVINYGQQTLDETYTLLKLDLTNIVRVNFGRLTDSSNQRVGFSAAYSKFLCLKGRVGYIIHDSSSDFIYYDFGEKSGYPSSAIMKYRVTAKTIDGTTYSKVFSATINSDNNDVSLSLDPGIDSYYDDVVQYLSEISVEFLSGISWGGGTNLKDNISLLFKDFEVGYESNSGMEDDKMEAYGYLSAFPTKEVVNLAATEEYSFKTAFDDVYGIWTFIKSDGKMWWTEATDAEGIVHNSGGASYLANRLLNLYRPIMSKRMQVLELDVCNDIGVTDNIYWDGKIYTVLAIEKHWWEEYNHIMIADLGKGTYDDSEETEEVSQ